MGWLPDLGVEEGLCGAETLVTCMSAHDAPAAMQGYGFAAGLISTWCAQAFMPGLRAGATKT
jgi:hypothetical protein